MREIISKIYDKLVDFGLACAPVRCAHPSFWGICHAKRGAARPPLLHIHTSKIKIIYRTRAARVKGIFQLYHRGQRVYRVPGLLYSRPNWVPHRLTCKRVLLPPLDPRGETHSLSEERVGGTNSDDGAYTLVFYTPLWIQGGGTHSLSEEGVGGTNSDDGAYTLVFYSRYTIISRRPMQ